MSQNISILTKPLSRLRELPYLAIFPFTLSLTMDMLKSSSLFMLRKVSRAPHYGEIHWKALIPVPILRRARVQREKERGRTARSYVAFSCALEEEAHDKDLQSTHADYQPALNQAKVHDPLLCAADCAEVAVLSRAEVFLISGDGGELAGDLEDRLLEGRGLFWGATLLGGEVDTGLVLDLWAKASVSVCLWQRWRVGGTDSNLKVDKLVCDSAHLIVEAERVVANIVAGEDKVSLALLLPVNDNLADWACNLEIDIE